MNGWNWICRYNDDFHMYNWEYVDRHGNNEFYGPICQGAD